MSDEILYVTKEELMALPIYPASTGGPLEETPMGTLWRRNDRACDPWLIGEWTGKVGHDVRTIWKEARVCTIQERIRMIREEKLAEFHAEWDIERKALQAKVEEFSDASKARIERIGELVEENKKLKEFREEVSDLALLQMTQPQQFGHQCVGNLKNLEDRLEALEKAQIDKTVDKNLRMNFCTLYNAVQRIIEQNDIRRDSGERYTAVMRAMEECKAFLGV